MIREAYVAEFRFEADCFALKAIDFLDAKGGYVSAGPKSRTYRRACKKVRVMFSSGKLFVLTREEFDLFDNYAFSVGDDRRTLQ